MPTVERKFIGGLFSGEPSSSSSSTEVNVPKWLETPIKDNLNTAYDLSQREYTPYEGTRVADFDPFQMQAFQQVQGLQGQFNPLINQATQLGQDLTTRLSAAPSMGDLQPYMDPYMQGVVDIQKRGAIDDYRGMLNNIGDQAAGAGSFGGSRQAILEAEAGQDVSQRLSDLQTQGLQTAFGNAQTMYNNQTAQQGNALGQLANFAQMGQNQQLTGIDALLQAGNLQQQREQALADVGYGDFLQQQNYPLEMVNFFSNISNPVLSAYRGTTTTGTAQGAEGSTAGKVIGGLSALGGFFADGGLVERKASGGLMGGDPYGSKSFLDQQMGSMKDLTSKVNPVSMPPAAQSQQQNDPAAASSDSSSFMDGLGGNVASGIAGIFKGDSSGGFQGGSMGADLFGSLGPAGSSSGGIQWNSGRYDTGNDAKYGQMIGQIAGTALGGPVGGTIGSALGSLLPFRDGGYVDNKQDGGVLTGRLGFHPNQVEEMKNLYQYALDKLTPPDIVDVGRNLRKRPIGRDIAAAGETAGMLPSKVVSGVKDALSPLIDYFSPLSEQEVEQRRGARRDPMSEYVAQEIARNVSTGGINPNLPSPEAQISEGEASIPPLGQGKVSEGDLLQVLGQSASTVNAPSTDQDILSKILESVQAPQRESTPEFKPSQKALKDRVNLPLLQMGLTMMGSKGDIFDQLSAGGQAYVDTYQGISQSEQNAYQQQLENLRQAELDGLERVKVQSGAAKDLAETYMTPIRAEAEKSRALAAIRQADASLIRANKSGSSEDGSIEKQAMKIAVDSLGDTMDAIDRINPETGRTLLEDRYLSAKDVLMRSQGIAQPIRIIQ
jgi:hypothetical protein